jgi:quercetin dioxygenase-like cupin family protein
MLYGRCAPGSLPQGQRDAKEDVVKLDRIRRSRTLGAAVLATAVAWAGAQSSGMKGAPPTTQPVIQTAPEVLNLEGLAEQGKLLLDEAREGAGTASVTLAHYRDHYTMLTACSKSSGAVQHTHASDFLIVVSGEGTELTGGTIVDRGEPLNGEIKGTRLDGATPHSLRKGDLMHISSGTPHQLIEGPGQSIVLYVIKVEEPSPAVPEAQ